MTMRTTVAATALAVLACFSFTDTADARGAGGLDTGNRPGGGAARGGAGASRPRSRPSIPGKSGATGGTLLEERRARKKRLDELGGGDNRPETFRAPRPAPAGDAPTGRRGRQGGDLPMPAPTPDTSLTHMHHGKVHMFGGLARVDLTLEVQNVGRAVMEWRRTYAIDPAAEVIGATLMRRNQLPIRARTLTTFDAFQCYARIRTPPVTRPTPRPRRPRDPLLVSRPQRDELHVQIWPIAVDETIRVELTFVTPLRGEGIRRTYRDVMGGPTREHPRMTQPDELREQPRRVGSMVDHKADWLMHPGTLVLSTAKPDGMRLAGDAGGRLKFTGMAATRPTDPAPTVPFLSKRKTTHAQLVGHRTLASRIAVFRFDPAAYLKQKGFVLTRGMTIKLGAVRGETRRLAPNAFEADGEPRPVTGQVIEAKAESFPYQVRVIDRHGNEVVTFDETLPLARPEVDKAMQAAVGGWHRAQIARRVFASAGAHGRKREEATRYAVDLGVLMPGIAAIAIPANERERLTPRLRRLYQTDGVPLGAPRREADVKQPPHGAFDDDFLE